MQKQTADRGNRGSDHLLENCICTVRVMAFLLVLASPQYRAYATPERTAAVPFLLTEPGSRAVGMGGAYTAVADNSTATFYPNVAESRGQNV